MPEQSEPDASGSEPSPSDRPTGDVHRPVDDETSQGSHVLGWFSPLRIGVAVVLIAAALVAWSLTGSATSGYRTAVVGTGTVEATLDSVGTITPVNQADLNFDASGTVERGQRDGRPDRDRR